MQTSQKYQFQARDATREGILLRLFLAGPAGSGKSYTALSVATFLVRTLNLGPVYAVDVENKSLLKYAYSPRRGTGFQFKHVPMPADDQSIEAYTAALDFCEAQRAGVIVVDSFSPVWAGIGGVLESVDRITEGSTSKNAFSTGWRKMSPAHTRFVQRILESPCHIIGTLRSEMDYVISQTDKGKLEPTKVGLGPVARKGIEYEPDLFCELVQVPIVSDVTAAKTAGRKPRTEVRLIVAKTRCDLLPPGDVFMNPGDDFAQIIADWLSDAPTPAEPRTVGEALAAAIQKASEPQVMSDSNEKRFAALASAKKGLFAAFKKFGVSPERMVSLGATFNARFAEECEKAGVTAPVDPRLTDGAPPQVPGSDRPPPPAA